MGLRRAGIHTEVKVGDVATHVSASEEREAALRQPELRPLSHRLIFSSPCYQIGICTGPRWNFAKACFSLCEIVPRRFSSPTWRGELRVEEAKVTAEIIGLEPNGPAQSSTRLARHRDSEMSGQADSRPRE